MFGETNSIQIRVKMTLVFTVYVSLARDWSTVRVIDDIDVKKPTDDEFCQDKDGDTMLLDVEIIAVPQI